MNNLVNNNNTDIDYIKSDNILQDIQQIIEKSQRFAWQAINIAMVQRNCLLGKRIVEEELQGENRAKYGAEMIKQLSIELTGLYGKGFDYSSLYKYTRFYKAFPDIFHTVGEILDSPSPKSEEAILDSPSPKSEKAILDSPSPKFEKAILDSPSPKFEKAILDSPSPKSYPLLTWTHYRILLQVEDTDVRYWYMHEAAHEMWSVRTLQRNISSQYYYRLLKSHKKKSTKSEMQQITSPFQQDKLEFIKNPVIAEFLGLSPNNDFTESELEMNIISNLQKFLMELGKGYAFVARQQHIHTEKQEYYIDLVFYNYYLKCFVLIDLKTSKITHQDVGQMDMYIRMYDELKRIDGDNPTLGIILCADTDEDIAKYSVLHGNEQLFASKYKIFLPSEEELRREIEHQKRMFYLQQQEVKNNNPK
ncbi:MAG: PDDEXK nuclease domain-containing protein [Prevotellaceae bacterium]|jgi:predicted nuclease of restriction endonuclease-like (RecB) superfamily|nr:PDDEXK nuclease domain-containing protein [Prevotellaceae bacterium]